MILLIDVSIQLVIGNFYWHCRLSKLENQEKKKETAKIKKNILFWLIKACA